MVWSNRAIKYTFIGTLFGVLHASFSSIFILVENLYLSNIKKILHSCINLLYYVHRLAYWWRDFIFRYIFDRLVSTYFILMCQTSTAFHRTFLGLIGHRLDSGINGKLFLWRFCAVCIKNTCNIPHNWICSVGAKCQKY